MLKDNNTKDSESITGQDKQLNDDHPNPQVIEEIGGSKGPEPTRFGDWEKKGRCIDF